MSQVEPVTYRLALVVSGAVSLGTYEAGVLAQLYRDVYAVNDLEGRRRVAIDVIAGASAGAMTGLILAQALARSYSPDKLEEQMRSCWVDRVDILQMLQPLASPSRSVLSRECIDRIAGDILDKGAPPSTTVTPAHVLALWINLTNLDGIPYEVAFEPGQPFSFYASLYRDYSPFLIAPAGVRYASVPIEDLTRDGASRGAGFWEMCSAATWEDVKDQAVVSGAFPLAFPTRPLFRDLKSYPASRRFWSDPDPAKSQLVPFQYADGGILNNEPVGRAIDAASYLNHLDPPRSGDPRTYVIVEPAPSTFQSLQAALANNPGAREINGLPAPAVLEKLVSVYFNDALYSDFERASKTNARIRALDRALEDLPLPAQQKEAAAANIRHAVGLDYKSEIDMERIPRNPEAIDRHLRGSFAGHFGGFLDTQFRAHDFSVGRQEARAWLQLWAKGRTGLEAALQQLPPVAPVEGQDVPGGWTGVRSKAAVIDTGTHRAEVLAGRCVPGLKLIIPLARWIVARWLKRRLGT